MPALSAMDKNMNFDKIKYETHTGRGTTSHGLYVTGNNWVPKARFVEMWEQVQKKLPLLDWSYPKTTKSFFEPTEWKGLKRGRRIALGRCLRYFADHQLLPIRCINPHKKGTKRYALVPSIDPHTGL